MSRAKYPYASKVRKEPQSVVFRCKEMVWYLICAETASDNLQSFLVWFLRI